jgi:acyl carrier protein
MKQVEFLKLLQDLMQTEVELEEELKLEDLEEFDSLAILSLVSMYDKLGVNVRPGDIADAVTVLDLIKMGENKING